MNPPQLLLVDDRSENLVAFEQLLEDFDVSLLQARSGEEALQLLLHHDVALVILDIQMPGMDGYEVASLMRQASHTRTIPIIFVTAINRDMKHKLHGYELGAADFLTKPIEPGIFRSKVRVFLELDRKTRELEYINKALEQSLADLRRVQEHNALLLTSIGEGIISLDTEGVISYANPAAHTLLGAESSLTGEPVRRCLAEDNAEQRVGELLRLCLEDRRWEGIIRFRRQGGPFPAEVTATPFHQENTHGSIMGISLVFEDITERTRHEEQLLRASEQDPLTQLTNRAGFERQLDEQLQRHRGNLVLLFIDLDGFKPINDQLGHKMGDEVLVELARRFQRVMRDSDLVARIGGDEFCVLALASEPDVHAEVIANKLLQAARQTIDLEAGPVTVGASIGIAIPGPATTGGELVEEADKAMYSAKEGGGDALRQVRCRR